jgi:Flp pilus assembly pilin Flp
MTKFVTFLQAWVAAHKNDEEGAAMVEYGLLVAFIALVALVGATALGVRIDALFDRVTF